MDDPGQRVLERQRMVWSLGDYAKVAEILRPASVAVVDACGVGEGTRVLDVGAGTGNLAIEAARRGADVVATDLTPALIEIGRRRSHDEGFEIEWREADAQNLGFQDGSFDVVASVFGAMFAPDADAAVREMLRVTKPRGIVAFTAWASDGYTGRSLAITSGYLPPPPEGVDTAGSWGDEDVARSRFERHADTVEVRRGVVTWDFASADEARSFLETNAPPFVAAKSILPPERFDEMTRELEDLRDRFNKATDGRITIDSEYLLVLARR